MKIQKWQIALAGIGAAALIVSFSSCVSIPKGAKAVKPFQKDRYLGKWYEICRMDFKFEKNLNNVTANYTLKDDGSIKVDNKGYNYLKKEWKESTGKAKFVENDDVARLKVSFFGPFYAGYNVIAIDKDYKYAMVAGNNLEYLWLLSRETTIPPAIITEYLKQAKSLGYDVNKLVWTKHDK
ncbi:lipocalin family protein [Mucilaginibacter psychrotolerans]|uniref:Outer membrane lipoprotein Blc n=1 Tax=Mucilaginibacter psychrotolerans TaxID=1524096 RepID=A0A4Y8SAI1_9SPHI|nr:lipocalin family protein [Mucilaginibacter psychrotolerans]TFF35968.1 lipocalin [Mucilaginibacter psychrotolerans]